MNAKKSLNARKRQIEIFKSKLSQYDNTSDVCDIISFISSGMSCTGEADKYAETFDELIEILLERLEKADNIDDLKRIGRTLNEMYV